MTTVRSLFTGDQLAAASTVRKTPPRALAAYSDDGFSWLRMLADHTAVAIANARAFEEILQLRRQLELENEYLRAEVDEAKAFGEILGTSPALRNVLDQIELVAPTRVSGRLL